MKFILISLFIIYCNAKVLNVQNVVDELLENNENSNQLNNIVQHPVLDKNATQKLLFIVIYFFSNCIFMIN